MPSRETKVLLTGANGFVGSRILARFVAEHIPTVLLLRPTGTRQLIRHLVDHAEVRPGALEDSASLSAALEGVTHVVHCAGKTKALHASEFQSVNVEGTRRLVEALNARADHVRRLVVISSLAASHPATADAPAREEDPSAPVSAYGRSKLAAEQVVRELARMETVVLRPGGVYGPGDTDFFQLFKAVQSGWCPQFAGGRQPLNLVYADDVAEVVQRVMVAPAAAGRTYHVAHPRVFTAGELTAEVAKRMERHPRTVPLPLWSLVPLSWGGELASRLTRKPGILGIDRRRELMAPGWVCDTSRLRTDLGYACPTDLGEGIGKTLNWYREAGWL